MSNLCTYLQQQQSYTNPSPNPDERQDQCRHHNWRCFVPALPTHYPKPENYHYLERKCTYPFPTPHPIFTFCGLTQPQALTLNPNLGMLVAC